VVTVSDAGDRAEYGGRRATGEAAMG
jgi:hypothetical protein